MPPRRIRDREAEVAVVRSSQPRSSERSVAGATERRLPGAMDVPIEQVVPDPGQPRQNWSHDDGEQRLQELARSIEEFGILQPLLVYEEGTTPDGRQRYVVIAGGRRRAAAELAGQSTVPVVVRGTGGTQLRIIQLIENLQRQELSRIDEARAFQELIDLESLTPPGLAARLHVSAQHVRDRLRVLADEVLAAAVQRGQISATAAREIGKLPDEAMQAFRLRVQAGERVQTSDVALARARLDAAGTVNPRRKRAPVEQSAFVSASTAPPSTAHETTAPSAQAGAPGQGGPARPPDTNASGPLPNTDPQRATEDTARATVQRMVHTGQTGTAPVPSIPDARAVSPAAPFPAGDTPDHDPATATPSTSTATDRSAYPETGTWELIGTGTHQTIDARANPDLDPATDIGLGAGPWTSPVEVAVILAAGLHGAARSTVGTVLGGLPDTPARDEWWLRVLAELQRRLH